MVVDAGCDHRKCNGFGVLSHQAPPNVVWGARKMRGIQRMNFDKELDARGMSCPLPILKTKKSLSDMVSGQILKVLATDSGAPRDMQAFANQTGNALLSSEEAAGEYIFLFQKK